MLARKTETCENSEDSGFFKPLIIIPGVLVWWCHNRVGGGVNFYVEKNPIIFKNSNVIIYVIT